MPHDLTPADLEGPMDAQERARFIHDQLRLNINESQLHAVAEQIRQAEQAARKGEFAKGFKRGQESARTARNISGCCCQIDDDGETILSVCLTHKVWGEAAREKAFGEAEMACLAEQRAFGSTKYATNQPFSSHAERFACGMCAKAIRALKAKT